MGQTIAVLGAGPMGLAVAYQLLLDGHRPVVYEADDRVGGMAACFDFGGMAIERYYHFHCVTDRAFLALLDELGIADRMRWVETRMAFYHDGVVSPWGNPLALLKFPGLGLVAKLRYGLHAFMCVHRRDWRPLDGLEASAWIKRWVGEEAYEVLWRKLLELKFHDDAHGLSAAWIWSRIRRIGRSRYDLFREKLGYLDGGSTTLLDGLRDRIEAGGGEIRLSSRVDRVVIDRGVLRGIVVGGSFEPYSKVISTVPMPFIADLMPDLPPASLARYRALRNIAVVCVIVKLARRVTENFWLNVNDDRIEIPGIVEYSNLRPLSHHVVYVPFYMPVNDRRFEDADSVFIARVRLHLCRINPALSDADFIDAKASRYRFAQPICTPGFLATLPPVRLPVAGLWAADTSFYYPEDRGISESIDFGRRLASQAASEPGAAAGS
jgi:protoporphyrinogen oxidase